jgi:hypothetical protein
VATGFIYNEKALRKLVPNRPRMISAGGRGGSGDNSVSKEILELQQQLARLARNMEGGGGGVGAGMDDFDDGRLDGPRTQGTASNNKRNASASSSKSRGGTGATGWSDANHSQGLGSLKKPGKPLKALNKNTNEKGKRSSASVVSRANGGKGGDEPEVHKWDPEADAAAKSKSKSSKDKDGEIHGIKIGAKFMKTFEGHGTFQGTVMSYSKEKKYFSVTYEDGDTEELKTDDLRALMGLPPRKRKSSAK